LIKRQPIVVDDGVANGHFKRRISEIWH